MHQHSLQFPTLPMLENDSLPDLLYQPKSTQVSAISPFDSNLLFSSDSASGNLDQHGLIANNIVERTPELSASAEIRPGFQFADSIDSRASDYRLSIGQFAQPYITINDNTGASGSREFAEPFDAVAAISNNQGRFCSGTLIAPDLVLTARHCQVDSTDHVAFGDDAESPDFVAEIDSVSLPAGSEGIWFDGNDVALVHLNDEVPQSVAQPLRLTGRDNSLVGSIASIFGYGNNGTGSQGHGDTSDGFRWGGQNVISFYGEFGGGENLFVADFDNGESIHNTFSDDPNPLPLEAITTEGDSGSPLLIEDDGEFLVAGITSGGLDIDGRYGSLTFWTGVANFAESITNFGGEFDRFFVPGSDEANEGVSFPAMDDHADELSSSATTLGFEFDEGRFTARDSGFIGSQTELVERDVFRFETSLVGRLIVDARSIDNNLDLAVQVFDLDGNFVGENDDAINPATNNLKDSQLIINNLPAGQYFVAASANNGGAGAYRLAVRSRVTEFGGSGNSFNSALRIIVAGVPTTFTSESINLGIERDFFEFVAPATGRMVVRSRARNGNLNTVLRAYNADRDLLDANNNFRDSLNSKVGFNVVKGESYFLMLNSVRATRGDYLLSLRLAAQTNVNNGTPFSLRLDSDQNASDLAAVDVGDLIAPDRDATQGMIAHGIG